MFGISQEKSGRINNVSTNDRETVSRRQRFNGKSPILKTIFMDSKSTN